MNLEFDNNIRLFCLIHQEIKYSRSRFSNVKWFSSCEEYNSKKVWPIRTISPWAKFGDSLLFKRDQVLKFSKTDWTAWFSWNTYLITRSIKCELKTLIENYLIAAESYHSKNILRLDMVRLLFHQNFFEKSITSPYRSHKYDFQITQ